MIAVLEDEINLRREEQSPTAYRIWVHQSQSEKFEKEMKSQGFVLGNEFDPSSHQENEIIYEVSHSSLATAD